MCGANLDKTAVGCHRHGSSSRFSAANATLAGPRDRVTVTVRRATSTATVASARDAESLAERVHRGVNNAPALECSSDVHRLHREGVAGEFGLLVRGNLRARVRRLWRQIAGA